jgi:inorganic pyrophosphatase
MATPPLRRDDFCASSRLGSGTKQPPILQRLDYQEPSGTKKWSRDAFLRGGAMSKNGKNGNHLGMADPSRLKPVVKDDKQIVRVVIETPQGSRNKYAFDQKERMFEVKKVLPAGMVFPYSFGFVPSTLADDGDPVDVLVLMDEPAFPGCVVKCRLVGVIEGEQENKKKATRNDRIVAVDMENHQWAHIEHVDDLGKLFVNELEEFFVNFHNLEGKKYRILDVRGPGQARRCVEAGRLAAKKS